MTYTINLDHPVGALKTQLSKLLLSVDRVGWNTGNTNGRFDVRRASRLLAGSERVFKQRTETPATTTAVSIIVDISGSMSCHDNSAADYEALEKKDASSTRIGVAAQCAFAIATAVERSNCDVEVIGFGSGNGAVQMNDKFVRDMHGKSANSRISDGSTYQETKLITIKRFGHKTGARRRAFEMLYNACNFQTADYQAVRTVVEDLAQRPEQRKIAIVLTDGCGDVAILRKFCDMSEKLYDIPVLGVGIQTHEAHMNATYKRFVMVRSLKEMTERAISELIAQIKK